MLRCTKPPRIPKSYALLRLNPASNASTLKATHQRRTFSSTATARSGGEPYNPADVERAEDEVDVCIVGGGPAGLSAAIRLKQLEKEKGREIRVVVLEKGSEIGAHIVSGAVLEPRALSELIPDWQTLPDHPLTTPATSSRMVFLTPNMSLPLPHPPQMNNKGNYIISLSAFTRWLASIAEELGVEIYPGFAGAELVFSETEDSFDPWGNKVKSVRGVRTGDVGLTRDFKMKSSYEPGVTFKSKITLLAEGAHGSLSKQAIALYDLRKESTPQTYALGMKEVWRVAPEKHNLGEVVHTMGWPLGKDTYGGGWIYHMDGGLVSLGLVVGLDYKNPYLSPYCEFQRMKHHPYFRSLLSPSSSSSVAPERLAYAARTLTEGGLQSVPRLNFPGGALIGCSAGFVNVAKIKGTHNAMKSGMVAAEAVVDALEAAESESDEGPAPDLAAYDTALHKSWVHTDLWEVRNLRPSFNTSLGLWGGILYSGIDSLFLKGRGGWTFKWGNKTGNSTAAYDASYTDPAHLHKPIDYPAFQPPLSTDLMTSVALTGTNHAEDQPVHLRVVKTGKYTERTVLPTTPASTSSNIAADANNTSEAAPTMYANPAIGAGIPAVSTLAQSQVSSNHMPEQTANEWVEDEARTRREHVKENVGTYAGLLGRACPAGVYEYVKSESVEGVREEGKEGESGGWEGHELVINSQNCIHCKLCDIKVPTQDITWTVPQGGGGPKYSIT